MKKSELRQIIKEEIKEVLNEKNGSSFSNPLEEYSDEYKELLKKLNRTLDLKERNKLIDAMNALPDRKRLGLKPLTKVK